MSGHHKWSDLREKMIGRPGGGGGMIARKESRRFQCAPVVPLAGWAEEDGAFCDPKTP